MMGLSAEEELANEQLTDAVQQVMNLLRKEFTEPAMMLGDFVVIVAQHGVDDDGDPLSAYSVLYRDGEIPHHRALGLVAFAEERLRADLRHEWDL